MNGPSRLPTVLVEGIWFFFDERLSQLRNVENPHDFIDLSTTERDAIRYTLSHDVGIQERDAT